MGMPSPEKFLGRIPKSSKLSVRKPLDGCLSVYKSSKQAKSTPRTLRSLPKGLDPARSPVSLPFANRSGRSSGKRRNAFSASNHACP